MYLIISFPGFSSFLCSNMQAGFINKDVIYPGPKVKDDDGIYMVTFNSVKIDHKDVIIYSYIRCNYIFMKAFLSLCVIILKYGNLRIKTLNLNYFVLRKSCSIIWLKIFLEFQMVIVINLAIVKIQLYFHIEIIKKFWLLYVGSGCKPIIKDLHGIINLVYSMMRRYIFKYRRSINTSELKKYARENPYQIRSSLNK